MAKAGGAELWAAHISKSTLVEARIARSVWGEDMGEVEVPVQMTSKVRAYSRKHPYRRL